MCLQLTATVEYAEPTLWQLLSDYLKVGFLIPDVYNSPMDIPEFLGVWLHRHRLKQ